MTATLSKVTVREMEENPTKWERFELYRGEPIEMTYTKPTHGKILLILGSIILAWIRKKGYGEVYGGESGIKFGEFTRYAFDLGWSDIPLPGDEIPTKSLPLMVEIVSESNDANHLLNKVEDYLLHGAKEVWLVYPKREVVQVYYPDLTARIFHKQDTILPGEWMKDFQLPLTELFL